MCEGFAWNFGDKRNSCCITKTHRFTIPSLPWNFFTKNKIVVFHPPYFSLFPQLKVKLKGLHFRTIEVIEAESQAVLKIFAEHYFQDAEGLGTVHTRGRGLLGE
jgi:hypothetical protein